MPDDDDIPSGPNESIQQSWDTGVVKATISTLTANLGHNQRTKARLLPVQRKESGAWLTAPPTSSLGLSRKIHSLVEYVPTDQNLQNNRSVRSYFPVKSVLL